MEFAESYSFNIQNPSGLPKVDGSKVGNFWILYQSKIACKIEELITKLVLELNSCLHVNKVQQSWKLFLSLVSILLIFTFICAQFNYQSCKQINSCAKIRKRSTNKVSNNMIDRNHRNIIISNRINLRIKNKLNKYR